MPASPDLAKLVDQMPSPAPRGANADAKGKNDRPGILSHADKEAMDKALAELRAGGREAVVGLVGMLADAEPATASKARHALHALAIQAGTWKDEERDAFADALAGTLGGDRPKDVQAFVVRQIQLAGGKSVTPALAKLLTDEALSADATSALLAAGGGGAAEAFRAALPKAGGRVRLNLIQGLGALKDAGSAEALRKFVTDEDRDTRTTAAWAVANIGDAGSVDALVKAADASQGYERAAMTKACLLLAENLTAAGKRDAAGRIYKHLRDTRTDEAEAYVKEIADKALGGVN